jgi:outer membrane protein assembly factor BamD (BamD/ComL family)
MTKCNYFAAQDDLLKYLERRPDDGRAVASLARAQLLTADPTRAQQNYRLACQLLLGSLQRGEAEDLYRESLRAFEELTLEADLQLDLAFGLERNLKPGLALCAYTNFERRYPHHSEAPFALLRSANLHWNTFSDSGEAACCYQRLVTLYPGDSWADFAQEQIRFLALQSAL